MPSRSGKERATPSPKTEPDDSSVPNPDGLSAYELQRLENIKANEAVLASLNLLEAKADMGMSTSSRAPTKRGVASSASKKRKETPSLPTRSSARAKAASEGVKAAVEFKGIDHEYADGRIDLQGGEMIMPGQDKQARPEDLRKMLDPRTPLPFHRVNDEDVEAEEAQAAFEAAMEAAEEDEDLPLSMRLSADAKRAAAALPKPDYRDIALLDLIADAGAPAKAAGKATEKPGSPAKPPPASALSKCTLSEDMVVKVTKSATVHLQFQPRDDTLLLAAGDKDGHVSIWHADRNKDDFSDGVHLHKAHTQYISGLKWANNSIYSSSYDGTVKCLDVEKRAFLTLYHSDEHEISAFTLNPKEPTNLWLGTNDGEISAYDTRTNQIVMPFIPRHNKKVNTLSIDSHGKDWLLASASSDTTINIWDIRKLSAQKNAMISLELPQASQGAEWAPNGSGMLAATCFDDKLRVYSLSGPAEKMAASQAKTVTTNKGIQPTATIKHCTKTGRWVVPFRVTWTASGDAIICGGMNRKCEIYDATKGTKQASFVSPDLMTAIPSRNAAHPNGNVIACATNSGRVHLYQMP
mgnify:CR=1 FL=1